MAIQSLLSVQTKAGLHQKLEATFSDPEAIQAAIPDPNPPPKVVVDWLSRLKVLYGVPFNYLVPDEGMLPLESIRFFYLDLNWVDAMVDGAFSIGRNLTTTGVSASMNLDRAVQPTLRASLLPGVASVRANALGLPPPEVTFQTVSGFLLRSSLVSSYKNMGVNVYPLGHTPKDPEPKLLPLLRLEALGAKSDTLICLVDGDAYRVDIHEAPEHLHYAIDSYTPDPLDATKVMHKFEISDGTVTIKDETVDLDITASLRAVSPRTINITALAGQISANNNNVQVDSAVMGFEMTEGVGMVSFFKRNKP